jgi:hypothetical protein
VSKHFEPAPGTPFDPNALVASCIESGARSLLLDEPAFPPAFFDLETGIAGELLHHLSKYRLRLAAVVPDLATRPERFQEFALEANRGEQYRFFNDRRAAVAWLAFVSG